MNTPTIRSPIASANSAVRTIFGSSSAMSRARQRAVGDVASAVIGKSDRDCFVAALLAMTTTCCHCERSEAISLELSAPSTNLNLGGDDLFPHLRELLLVGGP